MNFNDYQKAAIRTGRPIDAPNELFHLGLGLVGEAGEIAEKLKKLVRDLDSDESKLDKADLIKELGDVLWYIAALANYLGIALDEVAVKNIAKLADRQARNQIKGSGDNR